MVGNAMWTRAAPLATIAAGLRSGQIDLVQYINDTYDWIEMANTFLQALLPEPGGRARLLSEASCLQKRFPDPASRPPLYGVLLGVKDVISVDGFPTRAGSQLPTTLFAGPEALCVSRLKAAGALVLGKTVTTEFAYFEPGPTRNPHHLEHTPGGSSSGSAAGVAAGLFPFALGTQTSGSILRPASFCGVVGLKPSYGRVSTTGLIFCAPSLDHIGFFAQDVAGIELVAPLLYDCWRTIEQPPRPVLGVPDGPYLTQASSEGLTIFEEQLVKLERAGYIVQRIPVLEDIETVNMRQMQIVFAEMAQVHHAWFSDYASLYAPLTAHAIRAGQQVTAEELASAHAARAGLGAMIEATMRHNKVDLWVCPAAPGPAPKGINTTGNACMNIPWTHIGLPAVSLPTAHAANGLPLGLQFVGTGMSDEKLVYWLKALEEALM